MLRLEALAGQHGAGGFEVLVADNGSRDDSRAAAEGFRGRLPGLRVAPSPMSEPSSAVQARAGGAGF